MCNKTEGDYQREQRERIVELEADREMLHRLISKMRQSENQTIEEVIEGVGELHPELTEARNAILTEGMARDTAEAQLRAVRRGWDLYDQAMKLPPEEMKRHGPMCDEATDIIDAALSDAPDSQDGGRRLIKRIEGYIYSGPTLTYTKCAWFHNENLIMSVTSVKKGGYIQPVTVEVYAETEEGG